MSERVIRRVRGLVAVLALGVGTSLLFSPGVLLSQEGEEQPCEFDNGEDEWACVELAHDFDNRCEGIDCYSGQEFCCLDPIIVETE